MNTRILLRSLTAAVIVALPITSMAAPGGKALDACYKAFTQQAFPSTQNKKLKLRVAGRPLAATNMRSTHVFILEAKDARTGAALARSSCLATRKGAVLNLTALQTGAPARTALTAKAMEM